MRKTINTNFDKRDKYYYVFDFELMLRDGYRVLLWSYGHMREYNGMTVDFCYLADGTLKPHIRHWWIEPEWCYKVKKNSKRAKHIKIWKMTRLRMA